MDSTPKSAAASSARRKSSASKKKTLIVTLKMSPKALQTFVVPAVKEESPLKDSTPTPPTPTPVAAAAPISTEGDAASESNANTPAASGTPAPSLMPPPSEVIKKKGVKRSSGVALGPDGSVIPKVRGKPGPKKKPRLEDGSIDPAAIAPRATTTGTTAHKLGPKANQGAINAGLRALDRSGKPCRKWEKGGFTLKSFTGVVWEIPRWTAPPRATLKGDTDGSATSDSSKENKDSKDSSRLESEKSTSAPDADAGSNLVSSPAPAPATPTPTPIAAA
ncbi:INO80 complex subunit 4 [Phlyctema vagabunda]|uniref:INO80 complex subunit 4 n=1 Tax=Phlyctema vagabunda TaxID=108571 RepID=A0ABR4PGJ5_9HELO